MSHDFSFADGARLFGLDYTKSQTIKDFEKAMISSKNLIIEVKTKPHENKKIYEQLIIKLQEAFSQIENNSHGTSHRLISPFF